MLSASAIVNSSANRAWTPPPHLTVTEWADENVWLGGDSPEKGRYRSARTPYVRGVMDCLSPRHPARWIVWEAGSQIGKTRVSLNWVGFKIGHDPQPMIITLPSEGVAKEWSDQRLTQLVDDTPCLRGMITDTTKKGTGNTKFLKKIRGTSATIKIAWSSSAKKLRSTPAADLLSDEVDGFDGDPDGEGDPLSLLNRRFTNFPRGKHYMCSTPGESPSRIHREYLKGDQRCYFVPCPSCGHYQRLVFKSIRWPEKPANGESAAEALARYQNVAYSCVGCGAFIPERHKTQMLADGIWVATADHPLLLDEGFAAKDMPALSPIFREMDRAKFVSFHLPAFYSPLGWYSWSDLAKDWESAHGDTTALKTLINTVFAEPWHEKGAKSDPKRLFEHAQIEQLEPAVVPAGALFLTAYVDVQDDWLALEVKGWGPGYENWSIYYEEIRDQRQTSDGKWVACRANEPELWKKLDNLLTMEWPCEGGGVMPIWCAGIDSGYAGENAGMRDAVYAYCSTKRQPDYFGKNGARVNYPRPGAGGINTTGTVVPTKGGPNAEKAIASITDTDAARKHANLRLITIGTIYCKDQTLNALRLEFPTDGKFPAGYCHYTPRDIRFFQELCNETRVVKAGGVEYRREGRNEPFDTAVGNLAMAELCGIRIMREADWQTLARLRAESAAPPVPVVVAAPAAAPAPRRDDWVGRAMRSGGDDWLDRARR